MRFYENNWWNIFVEELEKDDRAVYFGNCIGLTDKCEPARYSDHSRFFGAYMDLSNYTADKFLNVSWIDLAPKPKYIYQTISRKRNERTTKQHK